MKEWPLTRRPREPRPPIAEEDLGAWMAGEDVGRTSEHDLPEGTAQVAAESAVNGQHCHHLFAGNAVFGPQIHHNFSTKCSEPSTGHRSSPARELHSKAHGPSSNSAARGSSASVVILEGLGFASAAPAEEGRARPKRSPASAAEPTVGSIAVWLKRASALKAQRARAAADVLVIRECAGVPVWPRVGAAQQVAREILEASAPGGQSPKSVSWRVARDFAAGLSQLAKRGFLRTSGDDVGDGCLTWHGRSIPPLATGPRRG